MARERNTIGKTRRVVIVKVPREWKETALALTREAKNLYNTATFLLRQVETAYRYDRDRRMNIRIAELHPNQSSVIEAFNHIIDELNLKLRDKGKPSIPRLEAEMATPPLYSVLNATVLDTMCRTWRDNEGLIMYRRLPASCSQQVVLTVIDLWKAAFAAMAEYYKSQSAFTGKPATPGFLSKNDRFVLELPYAQLGKGLPTPRVLPDLESATAEQQREFYLFNLKDGIDRACEKRGWVKFTPRHIRIVPRGGTVKAEAVVELTQSFPDHSIIARLLKSNEDELLSCDTQKKRDAFFEKHLLKRTDLRMAGIDVGENNLLSVSFSTGDRGLVYEAKRFMDKMQKFDAKLDARLSDLATPRMRELQAKPDRTKAETIGLRKAQKAIFEDDAYQDILRLKQNVKSDFEHKIAHDLVEHCAKRGVDVIVIGQNKGMKNSAERSSKENRKSHLIAHHRIMSLIRYKAEAHGMVLLTTEESYTSKSSFVDDDVLPASGSKDAVPATFSGTRSAQNRNRFVRRADGAKHTFPGQVHADINAAFNMIRKLFRSFRFSDRLSFRYDVRWISPRCGATTPTSCR